MFGVLAGLRMVATVGRSEGGAVATGACMVAVTVSIVTTSVELFDAGVGNAVG